MLPLSRLVKASSWLGDEMYSAPKISKPLITSSPAEPASAPKVAVKKDATDDELWDVLARACFDEDVKSMPKGIDTKVGVHG